MGELWQASWLYIQAGGPVMWPLLAVSFWLWSLILRKAFWLLSVQRGDLEQGAVRMCLAGELAPPRENGPQGAALAHFLDLRTGDLPADQKYWEVAVRHQAPIIWRNLSTITVLAALAPILGLLGTVTGMLETFAVIQAQGTGDAQALAAGISEALITTQTGLLVAIPGLFAGYTLRRQARKIQQGLYTFQRRVDRLLAAKEVDSCFA